MADTDHKSSEQPSSPPTGAQEQYIAGGAVRAIGGEEEVLRRGRAGESAQVIADAMAALGISGWSRATVGRFVRQHLGSRRARRSSGAMPAAPAAPAGGLPSGGAFPAAPAAVPPDASLEQIEWWLQCARNDYETAKEAGNLAAQASFQARAVALLEAKRKATPEPEPDPNRNPDMIRLGEQVEARLLRLVDAMLEDK